MSDSTTGGYLLPTDKPLPGGLTLERYLQRVIVGVTGLAGSLVRPRYQVEPGKQPAEPNINWCSFSVNESEADASPYLNQGEDSTSLERHKNITLFVTFYGESSFDYAEMLRDGLEISQNRDDLKKAEIGIITMGRSIYVPEIINNRWFKRTDITINLRRKITRVYNVQTLASAEGTIIAEQNNEDVLTSSFNVED